MTINQFTGTLQEKKYLAEEVMFLSFTVPETVAFEAGQYVIIDLNRDGVRRLRSYSVLNPPSERGKIDLCVAIIPGGFASELFKIIPSGQTFTFRGPLGHFVFEQESKSTEHWFICVGTGLTPFYSMIKEHVTKFPTKKFVLLFGDKAKKDMLFHEEFLALEEKHPNFLYLPVLSREAWEGKRGHVQLHLPTNVQNKTFYICGLKEMVLETQEVLKQRGVAAENVKVERYT